MKGTNFRKREHLLVFVFSSVMFNVRSTTGQQKKYIPVRTYFLMFSCLAFFALAVDTAVFALAVDTAEGFLGGPILTEVRVDLGGWLDFEEEAI